MLLPKKLLLCLLAAVPGIIWSILGAALFRGEYFYVAYMVGGAVLSIFAALAMPFLLRSPWPRAARVRAALAIAGSILFGWSAALIVMGLLNLTPLCVGQNNGDGVNDVSLCLAYVALYGLVYTPLILIGSVPLALLAAVLTGERVKAL